MNLTLPERLLLSKTSVFARLKALVHSLLAVERAFMRRFILRVRRSGRLWWRWPFGRWLDTNCINQVRLILHNAAYGLWQIQAKTNLSDSTLPWNGCSFITHDISLNDFFPDGFFEKVTFAPITLPAMPQ